MKTTPHLIIAAIAVFLALIITAGPLLNVSGGFVIGTKEMKIAPTKSDLEVIPAAKVTNPLMEDLSTRASANPFTGKLLNPPDTRLPPPPPPPLDLPVPPAMPLPEK